MPIPTLRRSLFVALPVLAAIFAVACGGKEDGSSVNGGPGNGDQNNNVGNQPGSLDNPTGNGSGGGINSGEIVMVTPGSECAKGSAAADAIPAVVEMVIDVSGSMNWAPGTERAPRNGADSKWDITSTALKGAVAKLPANIAVGIDFYHGKCINNQQLDIGLLGPANSAQRRRFNTAVDAVEPDGGTPTHAAYELGVKTVSASKLEGRKFVLLITDGIPTYTLQCMGDGKMPVDNQPLIDAVDVAFKGAANVNTFVIGSPGSEDARSDLSKMATNGGTAKMPCSDDGKPAYCHLDMTTATDFAKALSEGLADVAGQIGTCEYKVPDAPTGMDINPKEVNVLYTHADGTQTSILKDDLGTCMSGWQYDNDTAPTKITLCGSDCDKVKADQSAKIDVIFGCDSETNKPVK